MPLDDLPGLDDDEDELPEANQPADKPPATEPPAKEIPASAETVSPRWTDKELDDWWEHDFGGAAYLDRDRMTQVSHSSDPDFREAYLALRRLRAPGEESFWIANPFIGQDPWRRLSREMKEKFRSGWEAEVAASKPVLDSVIPELAPLPPIGFDPRYATPPAPEPVAPVPDSEATSAAPGSFNWIWLVVPVVGAALVVGLFVLMGGSDHDPSPSSASVDVSVDESSTEIAVDEPSKVVEVPSTTEAVVEAVVEVRDDAALVDLGTPAVPFPTRWAFTATKTAEIVPTPAFMGGTAIGAELPWGFDVSEACAGDSCTYSTVVRPLIPDEAQSDVPSVEWLIDDTSWTLDVFWHSNQSTYGDGTSCAIENHWTYELTVTASAPDGGAATPSHFEGTWTQGGRLDLAASTGNVGIYCGEEWEIIDQWAIVGDATSS